MIILSLACIVYGLLTLWIIRRADQFREALKSIVKSQQDDIECSYCPPIHMGYQVGEHDEKCPVFIARKVLK